ncbi:hypothetical protein Pelo_17380 [Pelomyxa schiedti]|nr:hypothetical protein Pelo_17380 [Pelomyxa schiedti]
MGQTRSRDGDAIQTGMSTTTTSAQSQVVALCCCGVTRCSASCCPSLKLWVQSPSLVRQWAKDWVLRRAREAVFELPWWTGRIVGHRLRQLPLRSAALIVSLSATLGILHWSVFKFPLDSTVCGCVGNDRVMCSTLYRDESWRGDCRVLNVSMEEDGGAPHSVHRAKARVLAKTRSRINKMNFGAAFLHNNEITSSGQTSAHTWDGKHLHLLGIATEIPHAALITPTFSLSNKKGICDGTTTR